MANAIWEKVKSVGRDIGSNLAEPEGLATGVVGGLLFGGPVGVALGVGQGILAKRLRQNELDKATRDQEILAYLDEQQAAAQKAALGLAATDYDREQATQLGRRYDSLRAMATSLDPETKQKGIQGLAEFGAQQSAFINEVEDRNNVERDKHVAVLDQSATHMRGVYEKSLEKRQAAQSVSENLHRLLNDKSFDPNSGPGRAALAQAFGTTPRELLADPPDIADALAAAGEGIFGLQQWAAWKAGTMDAGDFVFTKEQWRQIAHAVDAASANQFDQVKRDSLAMGQRLDQAAADPRVNWKPAISYTEQILFGDVQKGPGVKGQAGAYGGGSGEGGGEGGPSVGGGPAQPGGPGNAPGEAPANPIATIEKGVKLVDKAITGLDEFFADPGKAISSAVREGFQKGPFGAQIGADIAAEQGTIWKQLSDWMESQEAAFNERTAAERAKREARKKASQRATNTAQ